MHQEKETPRPRTVPPWDLPTILRTLKGPPFEPLQSTSLRVLSLKKRSRAKQRIYRWLVDAISISILLLGVAVPHRSQSHQSHRLFLGMVQRGVHSDMCEAAGWSLPSTFARFYNLDVPALQARVLSA